MLQLRHTLNDYLRRYAGHIGYSVRPSERRRGVAKWMLAAALPYCRELGLRRVMIACEPWNEGSRRTILANGGVFEKTVHEPEEDIDLEQYWITL
jgi:predicted acetyltransferase